MKYIVRQQVLASVPEMEISKEEFFALKSARKVLSGALAIEEKYEILVANYLDLEKELLLLALTRRVRTMSQYMEFFGINAILNIRLLSLLTAARLYLDQFPQDAKSFNHYDALVEQFESRRKNEYEAYKEYRFMETLRNYTQHRGLPVHLVEFDARRASVDEASQLEYTLDIYAKRDYLEEDKKFKRLVLKDFDQKIDLMAATRRYMECISGIHEDTRTMIEEPTRSARALIEEQHERYAQQFGGKLTGLSALAMDGEKETFLVPLLLDWDDVRVAIKNKNGRLVNLSKSYVTGRLRQHRR